MAQATARGAPAGQRVPRVRSNSLMGDVLETDDVEVQRKMLRRQRTSRLTAWKDFKGDSEDLPGQQLLFAVENESFECVLQALEAGADLNEARCEGGQTALHKAIQKDNLELADFLLRSGADPSIVDNNFRSAFYYACFASNVKAGQHRKFVARLLAHELEETGKLCPFHVLMTAYASNQRGVMEVVLNCIEHKVLSKDSNGLAKFHFSGLEMLDNPNVSMRWPDGSSTEMGTTPIHVLVQKGNGHLLIHPVCLGLMEWKWQAFGAKYFLREQCVFFAQIAATNMLCLLYSYDLMLSDTPEEGVPDINNYVLTRMSMVRLVTEGCAVLLALAALLNLLKQHGVSVAIGSSKLRKHRFKLSWFDIFVPAVAQILVLALALCRVFATPPRLQVVLLSTSSFLQWERFVFYMSLRPHTGPFFIMLVEMFKRDLAPFGIILSAILVSFGACISVLVSTEYMAARNSRQYAFAWTTVAELLFGLTGTDSFNTVRAEWVRDGNADGLVIVFYMLFTIVGPILATNLLVAMMANTYSKINQNSVAEWALRRFRYLSAREAFVRCPHFGFRLTDAAAARGIFGAHQSSKGSAASAVTPANGSAQDKYAAPALGSEAGGAAEAAKPLASSTRFELCPDMVAKGFVLETNYDAVFKPYHDKSRESQVSEMHEQMSQLLLHMHKLSQQQAQLLAAFEDQAAQAGGAQVQPQAVKG